MKKALFLAVAALMFAACGTKEKQTDMAAPISIISVFSLLVGTATRETFLLFISTALNKVSQKI